MFLSILAVVLTVFALGSTTFAWFTLTNTATVQSFDSSIVADTGIEIALGDLTDVAANPGDYSWSTTLTQETIEAYIIANYGSIDSLFSHVTTVNGYEFNSISSTGYTSTSSGYLAIPLSFRSNSAQSIYWSTVSLTSTPYTWSIDANFTAATGTAVTTPGTLSVDASNGMRVAMLSDATYGGFTIGYEKPATTANPVLGGNGTGTGVTDTQNLADGVAVGEGDAGSVNYYYVKTGALPYTADSVTTLGTITDLGAGQLVVTMVDETGSGIDYGTTYFGQVTVYVWLEGWDANTYNSILAQYVSTSFSFTGV